MDYVLQSSKLKKNYGKACVLKDVTLNIPKGSIYGFIGKNGAGKTTLIRLICGLQEPSAGEYSLFGISNQSRNIAKSRRRMGAVVETPAVYMDMSATENLKQQCIILGLPSYNDIPDILKLVGLENTGKKKVRNFSLGMRQRLAIAIALIGYPDFVVLDEPTNGLDPQGIIEVRELILKLNREQGITFLISSHILDELSKLASHYGFINDGIIVKEIGAKELNASFRKRVEVTVSEIKKLTYILDSMKLEYNVVSDTQADVFDAFVLSDLVHELDKEDCKLISIKEKDENLETYYMNLVGGEQNE